MPYSLVPSLLGATAAGVLLYAVHEAMQDQTQFMVSTMQAKADALDRAHEFDKKSGERLVPLQPSAYRPAQPSFWEEVQSRWNHHVVGAVNAVREADPMSVFGKTETRVERAADGTASAMIDALHSLAPHAPDAQPKIGILNRTYGDANTHYLGQGASLR